MERVLAACTEHLSMHDADYEGKAEIRYEIIIRLLFCWLQWSVHFTGAKKLLAHLLEVLDNVFALEVCDLNSSGSW